jgi:hypothetical protein
MQPAPLSSAPSLSAALGSSRAGFLLRLFAACLCLSSSGCTAVEGGRRCFVFGLGVITVRTNQPVVASSSDVTAVAESLGATGLLAGPGPVVNGFMLGHTRRQTLVVSPRAEILLDTWIDHNGVLHADICSPINTALTQTNINQKENVP